MLVEVKQFLFLNKRSRCRIVRISFNRLSANPTKWSNTLKQLQTNCLSAFDHFVGLAYKGLKRFSEKFHPITVNVYKGLICNSILMSGCKIHNYNLFVVGEGGVFQFFDNFV